jgi:hypothetical protein
MIIYFFCRKITAKNRALGILGKLIIALMPFFISKKNGLAALLEDIYFNILYFVLNLQQR